MFKTLYVDRAGIFGDPKRCNFCRMKRTCEEPGIEIIFASSPQGKGRIERAFDTLQDRLIPELRLHNIIDMAGASSYLQHVFIPQFWRKKLTVKARTPPQNIPRYPGTLTLMISVSPGFTARSVTTIRSATATNSASSNHR